MSLADALNRLQKIPYVDHGRGPTGADCWGLTNLARQWLFNLAPLPAHADVDPEDKRAITDRSIEIAANMDIVTDPRAGDIFAGYSGGTLVHIGIVVMADGRRMVLHTRRATGPSLQRIEVMRRMFERVTWFRHAED